MRIDDATRPYPSPRAPWAMFMRWEHLLFMHWPVPAAALRPHIPAALDIDTWDGHAWLGIVPFTMTGIRARLAPPLPTLSAFHELNVRTYVTANTPSGPMPGVWFFSLDAACAPAVMTARALFHLNYYNADMSLTRDADTIAYTSTRTHRGAPAARLNMTYRPTGEPQPSKPGSFESFLTDRYRLFASDLTPRPRPRIWRGEIHHEPWPLAPAECDIQTNTMASHLGVEGPPAHCLFARTLDVVAWLPTRVPTSPNSPTQANPATPDLPRSSG